MPRPPACYISNPPDKIPMVFTDVSDFPRQPKPMSRRKAKHFPRTSLLPHAIECQSESQPSNLPPGSRRSNSTVASMSTRPSEAEPPYSTGTLSKKSLTDEQKLIVSELLRKFKGCSSSDAGLKMLDEFHLTPSDRSQDTLDKEIIKEIVLLRAGGLSFRNSMGSWDSDLSIPAKPDLQPTSSTIPEDEKQIRSMKYQMIKSIYMKKLELNQAGRLLLPKIVRTKQEMDYSILQHSGPKTSSSDETRTSTATPQPKLRRGDRLLRQCMKGPAGRMKQRQLLASRGSETVEA